MNNNRNLLRQLSSQLDASFLDEGSIVHSVVPSPHISRWPSRPRKGDATPKERRRVLVSFFVVYAMIFFNGCCFTAVVPSVPFYLDVLNAPPTFLGWVVSFYSLGQIFGSPLGGWAADKVSSRALLTISSTLGLFSSALYAVAPVYMFVLVSRFLTGVSAGMEFSVELTFIARNTTRKDRTVYLASVTAVNVVGFVMGPALGGLLAMLDLTIAGIKIDKYTGPGWLLTMMFVLDILMVQTLYRDDSLHADEDTDDEDTEAEPTEEAGLLKGEKQPEISYGGLETDETDGAEVFRLLKSLRDSSRPPPLSMVLGLIFVQFIVMSAWSVLETITSPLAKENFDWDVQECNLLFMGGGFVSLLAYFVFVVASKWVQDRWLITDALVVGLFGQMLAIDWPQLEWVPDWFSELLPSYRDRFVIGYALMNAGFMTVRPVTFALYSKLIGSQYQGKYLGWMVAGGSLARTLGPFAAVAVFYGVKTVGVNLLTLFGSVGMGHAVCVVLVIQLWQQLLPRSQELDQILTDVESGDEQIRMGAKKRKSPNSVVSINYDDDDDEGMCHITRTAHLSLRD